MKANVTIYQQNNTTFLSTVLNSQDIYNNSEVWVYGQHQYGYQREIRRDHVRGIEKYIDDNDKFIFPSSIILAIDEEEFINCNQHIILNNIVEIDFQNIKFRIVDGQHRTEALKQLKVNIPLNVIILVVNKEDRNVELDIFTNLNSKAKRIPTDLAELAKYKYQLLSEGSDLNRDDSADYVAMKTIIDLNETSRIWKNAIKVNIQTEENAGIITVTGFKKSFVQLVKKMLEKNIYNEIDALDNLSNEFYDCLDKAWEICYHKWDGCFNDLKNIKENHIYSNNFYIQKTMGVSVINGLLHEIYTTTEMTFNQLLDEFEKTINLSNVKISDWEIGGPMYGHSSEAGFKKIRNFIKGEIKEL